MCVLNEKSEWKLDHDDLTIRRILAYVWNIDAPENSEWGYIGFKEAFGGLIRTF